MTRPLIGITSDVEVLEGSPTRPWYRLDARNITALHEAGALAVMLPHEINLIEEYLDVLDGVMISGGGYQFPDPKLIADPAGEPKEKVARVEFEKALIASAQKREQPLFGVCGGFQVMNAISGGDLVPVLANANPDWASHNHGSFEDAAHLVHVADGTMLRSLTNAETFPVNSRHSQGVVEAPSTIVASAKAPDGVIEAIERPDMPFWLAVQWHPEFYISDADWAILRGFVAAAARRRGQK